MSSMKKILVFGATGAQGGSVINSLLKKKDKYSIRAVTRDPNSEKAKALKEKGVEVVRGDFNDKESIRPAFQGVYGVFAVTNFWDTNTMDKEEQQGKMMADMAKEARVQHYIWSTLPNVEKESNGKYKVPHFTNKARVEEYIRQIGLKATFVAPAFYYQNFQTFFAPREESDGTLVFTLPMPEQCFLTAIDIQDIGDAVMNVFNSPNEWMGKWIPLAGANMHPQEYIKEYADVTGKKAKYEAVKPEEYAKRGDQAREMAQMFGWFNEYTYYGKEKNNMSLGKKVNPNLKSWKQFLQTTGLRTNPRR